MGPTINVAPATLTVTANSASKSYGQTRTFAGTEFTTSGLVSGDSVASATLASAGAAASAAPGAYAIVPSAATGSGLSNYTITYVNGTLTVAPAALTITANNQTKVYGAALPVLTASYSGFINGDTASSLNTQPTLSTTATASSHVSGSPYGITAGGAADPDYTISYVPGTLTVTPAPLTITADNQSMVYGAALPALTAIFSGFVNGDTPASLGTQPALSTTATAGSHVSGSPYGITASGAADPDYSFSYVPGTLTVTPAPLTITADNQSMVYGAALPALTAGFSGFVNGDTPASLGTQPTLSTTATAGSHVSGSPYTITASGAADPDYSFTYVPGTLTVTPAPLTITADNQSIVYGAALPALTASFSGFVNGDTPANLGTQPALSTTATTGSHVSGSPYTITASGTADPDYTISYVPGTLTVTPAPLTITADNQSMVYGAGLPALTASFSGFVNGDKPASLDVQPTLSTTATAGSHVSGSPYTITASGAADPDYSFTYVPGTLTVAPAPLTITADNQSMAYGAGLPALTASFSGFVNGDTPARLGTQPTLATMATAGSHVSGSPYGIAASGAADPDYTISYVPGTLTVTPAPLTITADNQSMVYGAALPALTASFSGFENGDTPASLSVQPTLSTTATAGSHVSGSPYGITASGAADPDYTISYAAGILTVTPASLTITADSQSMVYGAALPALTASFSGFVNGDTPANLGTQPALSTTATAGSHVSSSPYTIAASGAADPDYTISYAPGPLTVTPAPLTITADNQNMVYGAALPALTASFSGFVNGDTPASLSTQPTLATTATAGSNVSGSPYGIAASGAADPDYTISHVPGTLTVTPATLTVTADNQTRVYGAADPPLTASFSGFVNGETLASSGVSGSPSLTSNDTAASPVGTYAILAAQGTLTAQNYTFSFVSGTLTVTQEVLTIDCVQTLDSLDACCNVAVVIDSDGDLTVNNPVTLDSGGAVSVLDGGRVTLPGIDSQPGATGIDLDSGTLRAAACFTTTAPITIGADGGTLDANGCSLVLAGTLTGPGGLTTTGCGIVTLSGTNSYTGGTTVSAGTLVLANSSAIAANTSLTIGAGGTLIFDPSVCATQSAVVAATTPAITSSADTTAAFVTASNDTTPASAAAFEATSAATSVVTSTVTPPAAPAAMPVAASVATPSSVSFSGALAKSSATVAGPRVASPLLNLPQVVNSKPAGGNTRLPTVPPVVSGHQNVVPRSIAPGLLPSSQSVPASQSRIPAVDRFVGSSLAGDLAWLGQASSGSDNSNPFHKKAAAILALEAVFAQYGR